jgi:hypothetical protein
MIDLMVPWYLLKAVSAFGQVCAASLIPRLTSTVALMFGKLK